MRYGKHIYNLKTINIKYNSTMEHKVKALSYPKCIK